MRRCFGSLVTMLCLARRRRAGGPRRRHRDPRLDGPRSHRPRPAAGAATAPRRASRSGARRRRVPRRRILDALARDAGRRLRRGSALAALHRRVRGSDPERPGVCAARRSRGAVRGHDRAPHGRGAHGMGDEVWDWLFEPNGPGLDESYLPSDIAVFVGPGGLEVQLDIVAIARHARPIGPTPAIPDAERSMRRSCRSAAATSTPRPSRSASNSSTPSGASSRAGRRSTSSGSSARCRGRPRT